ncbi:MAG: hypothetical protein A2521_00430 [Deltaproteobacteria bacterium RIFOXYD12_FULL_57_12]|nr:MAG: hypothetical protein A2521_00430 [Deltaproteobacteria bacterium RIFOXYD12_FULL_57_12]
MLLLLFEIGEGRYALTADQLVEVVPLVQVKKIPLAPPYVVGLLNYRGTPTPVLDLGELLIGTPCEPKFSTRTIIVNYPFDGKNTKKLGLIATQVTETVKTALKEVPASGVLMDESLYRLGTDADNERMIQWFDLKRMLPEQDIIKLFQD